ncbi:ribonuclease H-like domain-containing protein [Flammula alnicola]|nr:ribonuclease H-like domain-containing protein [Flammula alnicola]
MAPGSFAKGKTLPSGNWLSLQKQLKAEKKATTNDHHHTHERSRKRQKLDHGGDKNNQSSRPSSPSSFVSPSTEPLAPHANTHTGWKNGESLAALQQMALGHFEHTVQQQLPGKFLALDCEMVGVGIDGVESSLARVSLVNFYGAVIMDEFVRQKERVVDYRTQWSGIRESDMVKAKKFEDVQRRVSDLLKDRILVGHAVHNDMKALLLSHPWPQTRDTQVYSHKFAVCKSRRIALRNLVKQELGLTIQGGEHSSITDARATMAVYRLHKKEWEKGSRPLPPGSKILMTTTTTTTTVTSTTTATSSTSSTKRKEFEFADDESDSDSDDESTSRDPPQSQVKQKDKAPASAARQADASKSTFPGGGRKGVSSGLSTIMRHTGGKPHMSGAKGGGAGVAAASKSEWWKQLPGGLSAAGGAKGSIRVGVKR